MNFDNIVKMNDPVLKNLCRQAEKYARIEPVTSAFYARKSLDHLLRDYTKLGESLKDGIGHYCDTIEDNDRSIKNDLHTIRMHGNRAVHGDPRYDKIDAATQHNIDLAIKMIEKLYHVLSKEFGCNETFCTDRVPFLDCEIVRKVERFAGDTLSDDYCYFVKETDSDGEENFYLMQCLLTDIEPELNDRRNNANQIIKKNKLPGLLKQRLYKKMPENSDRKLVVYDASDDCYLLQEMKHKMSLKDALKLGLKLTAALLELKELGIHHRNISPACVLIDPIRNGKDFNAHLLNMQASKIETCLNTVCEKLPTLWASTSFIPPVLFSADLKTFNKWEAVDVYSVATVMLYCLDPERTITSVDDILALNLGLSYDFIDLYDILFTVDINFTDVPTLEELERIISNELEEC